MELFVYGTLMRGEQYHHLLARAEWLGEARTAPAYRLMDLGEYPAMLAGGSSGVAGELYRVDGPTLAALDDLEGHPELYLRSEILLDDGRHVIAYLLPVETLPPSAGRIEGGAWRTRRGNTAPAGVVSSSE